MKNYKKISAAVLATGLLASTSLPAWANETEKVDSSNFETVNLQDAFNHVKDKTTSVEDLQMIYSNIPLGFLANNIFALSLNLEKVSNPKAKAALQKNIDKAIVKWEEKNQSSDKTTDSLENDETNPVQTVNTEEKDKLPEPVKVVNNIVEKEQTQEVGKVEEVNKHEQLVIKNEERKKVKALEKEERKKAQAIKKEERKQAKVLKKEERKQSKTDKKQQKNDRKPHEKASKEKKQNKHKD